MTDQSTLTAGTTVRARARARLGHVTVHTPDLERFRRFYEDVLGLRLVVLDTPVEAPFRRLGAFADRDGDDMVLLAFEVPGYATGLPDDEMGRRGRLDHIAFNAADEAEFAEIVDRLVQAGASSGQVDLLGPVRSVLFVDPDGAHHNLQLVERDWQPGPTADSVDLDLLRQVQRGRG